MNDTVTVRDVAEIAGVSERTVYRWTWGGILPIPRRVGHTLVWDTTAVQQALARRAKRSPAASRREQRLASIARHMRSLGCCRDAIVAAIQAEAAHTIGSQGLTPEQIEWIVAAVIGDTPSR